MTKIIFAFAILASGTFITSCGGGEEKKELTLCDCLEDGNVKQTDECREIAGNAKGDDMEKCK